MSKETISGRETALEAYKLLIQAKAHAQLSCPDNTVVAIDNAIDCFEDDFGEIYE